MTRSKIPRPFLEVLQEIAERLEGKNLTWALTGSTSLALQGLPLQPNDIDLQTDALGAYEIQNLFLEAVIRPVQFRETARIRSHFGVLGFGDLRVEVMGEVQKRLPDGSWTSPPDLKRHLRFVEASGVLVPVLTLEYERQAYWLMGRAARAKMLAAWTGELSDQR